MIIAISGKSGCGNSTVSRSLAQRLGYRFVNYTFHNMAEELGLDFQAMLELAASNSEYDRRLDRTQVELARQGDCVIGSRLAIWLLRHEAFTVYLKASEEVRARRIWQREGGDLEVVRAFTHERDLGDHRRFMELYGIDNDDYAFCDLIVDAERLSPPEEVELIAKAAIGKAG